MPSQQTGKYCSACHGSIYSEVIRIPIEVGVPLMHQVTGPSGRNQGKGTISQTICYCGNCGAVYNPDIILKKG